MADPTGLCGGTQEGEPVSSPECGPTYYGVSGGAGASGGKSSGYAGAGAGGEPPPLDSSMLARWITQDARNFDSLYRAVAKVVLDAYATLHPGPYAGKSLPTDGPGRITTAQQKEVDRIGNAAGCHTCGAKTPGTKSGHWIGDHQPSRAFGDPEMRYYPHCDTCSHRQAGEVSQALRDIAGIIRGLLGSP